MVVARTLAALLLPIVASQRLEYEGACPKGCSGHGVCVGDAQPRPGAIWYPPVCRCELGFGGIDCARPARIGTIIGISVASGLIASATMARAKLSPESGAG